MMNVVETTQKSKSANNLFGDKMKNSINIHELPTDIIQAVVAILTKLGHPRPNDWLLSLESKALLDGCPLEIKRHYINRCFRTILGNYVTENTMDARYCLFDNGDIVDWLRNFEQGVAPCLIRNNLPPAMH